MLRCRGLLPRRSRSGAVCGKLAVIGAVLALAPASVPEARAAGMGNQVFISTKSSAEAPSGAADLCQRYDWACQTSAGGALPDKSMLPVVRKVNRHVNQSVKSVPDSAQYGAKEYWSLPSRTGGDCEDYALQKKHDLIAKGIAAQHLLLATVFSPRTGSHAVLILRMSDGDYVLDSMTDEIRRWDDTKYTFLRIQNPEAPQRWLAVFAGG